METRAEREVGPHLDALLLVRPHLVAELGVEDDVDDVVKLEVSGRERGIRDSLPLRAISQIRFGSLTSCGPCCIW